MMSHYGDNFRWFMGVVINNLDPLMLGRTQVRIFGIHSSSLDAIPNAKLPWATVMQPTTSGGTSGIGAMPTLLPGAQVVGFFMDGEGSQLPLIIGVVPHFEVPSEQQLVKTQSVEIGYGIGQVDPALARAAGLVNNSIGSAASTTSTTGIPVYPPDISLAWIEQTIRSEANKVSIDPNVAVRLWKAEGGGQYQSGVTTGNQFKRNGREASYGPFQLYVGGGMGNDYEAATGRDLQTDNTRDGVTKQIEFALAQAKRGGWGPWYGRKPAGIAVWEGIRT